MTPNPRETALYVLNTLDQGKRHLDDILACDLDRPGQSISMRDRRLINALVYGVLRRRRHLDRIIEQHSDIPIKKIQPRVLNILRLGVFQVFFLDRIPDSAAVNTAVAMAKKIASPWAAGFVNALLRHAVRKKSHLPDLMGGKDAVATLAVVTSFPEWLVRRWIKRYGPLETETLCHALNEIPPVTVRANTLKTDRDRLLEALRPEVREVRATPYSLNGLYVLGPKKPIHKLTAFEAGLFQVQDEAAQLVSFLLSPRPGDRVLDACAGLGGKTGHLAQLMQNRGQLIAMDVDEKKLSRLKAEMKRLGVDIVETLPHDLERPAAQNRLMPFDCILLDAPCSGLGVIRRNPDIRWDDSRKNLAPFAKKQIKFLTQAAEWLNPEGILVYAVCSLEPEETDQVVGKFLKNKTGFKIIKKFSSLLFDISPFMDEEGFFRTVPHLHQTDGFFAAALKRLR